ncbi:hypothetical protein DENSPDRAFT_333813 [Dentipellis sp. KUC8613]|nr:hypothetical protein DENSPDRAFT_333813 [Dentipellis sp. KUC8613]
MTAAASPPHPTPLARHRACPHPRWPALLRAVPMRRVLSRATPSSRTAVSPPVSPSARVLSCAAPSARPVTLSARRATCSQPQPNRLRATTPSVHPVSPSTRSAAHSHPRGAVCTPHRTVCAPRLARRILIRATP